MASSMAHTAPPRGTGLPRRPLPGDGRSLPLIVWHVGRELWVIRAEIHRIIQGHHTQQQRTDHWRRSQSNSHTGHHSTLRHGLCMARKDTEDGSRGQWY